MKDFVFTALSLKGVVYLFGKLCLLTAVALTFASGERFDRPNRLHLPQGNESAADQLLSAATKPTLESYQVILTRRIFGAPAEQATTSAPPPTKLKLRLVGTNLGRQTFAIIEDTAKNEQDVFAVNDSVFNQARLLEIFTESVRLEHGGRIETLLFEEGKTADAGDDSAPSTDQTDFSVSEAELSDALANLPVLLSEARAVPYFRNGQSVGMRLFAIRRDSLYEKLGLKNGDIVLAVNDNSLSDPSQALKLFEQLRNERSVAVKLERNGEPKQLQYSIR